MSKYRYYGPIEPHKTILRLFKCVRRSHYYQPNIYVKYAGKIIYYSSIILIAFCAAMAILATYLYISSYLLGQLLLVLGIKFTIEGLITAAAIVGFFGICLYVRVFL